MKIEVGESVLYSWLRHVQGCAVTQLNWKTSPHWVAPAVELRTMRSLAEAVQNNFRGVNWVIFKNDQDLSQALRQVECDAIGIKTEENGFSVYAMESAFHENGLNYGGREVTCAKVVSKLVRVAIALNLYMRGCRHSVIFVSPKISDAIQTDLTRALEQVSDIFEAHGYPCDFQLIGNDDYLNTILHPVVGVSQTVSDTSELFLRSLQLMQIYGEVARVLPKRRVAASQTQAEGMAESGEQAGEAAPEANSCSDIDPYEGQKVGAIAKKYLREWIETKCDEQCLKEFLDKDKSKQIFDINLPLLCRPEGRVVGGHPRYYSEPLFIMNEEYYMCSQWFATSRPKLIKWLEQH